MLKLKHKRVKKEVRKSMSIPVEIERKYVIAMPDTELLKRCDAYTVSDIEQTYLESSSALTHRVRARRYTDKTVYTETKKVRIDKMSVFEDEKAITETEYKERLNEKKEGTVTLSKTRHTFIYLDKTFEIDIYPEWKSSAILETELSDREETVVFPDFIRVICEVTGDKKYTNASMSREFPKELI